MIGLHEEEDLRLIEFQQNSRTTVIVDDDHRFYTQQRH